MRLPLSEHNPFLTWLKSPSFADHERSSDDKAEAWMSQIEVFTYSEPYRRLFKVPQFHFITLQPDVQPADLVSPSRSKSSKNVKAVPVVIEASSSLSRSYNFYESIYGDTDDGKYDTMVETLKDALRDTTENEMEKMERVKFTSAQEDSYEYVTSRNSSSSSEKYSRSSAECDSINLPLGALDP
uniref:Uncharacterized protein n=1 Tax=Syphacia muris TaxID=451379 RepID=A0A0N5A8G3_9BILA